MSNSIRGLVAFGLILLLAAGCVSVSPPTATPAPPTATPLPATPTATIPPTLPPTPSASPTPVATARPTDTPAPTPTAVPATPTSQPATGIALTEAAIAAHLDALAQIADQNGGLRAAGLPGYDASVEYVAAQLASFGYEVERHSFAFAFFNEAAPVTLAVGDQSWSGGDWLHAMIYSAPGEIDGVVETVSLEGAFSVGSGGCAPADWDDFTAGHIALVGSGPCFYRDQVDNAQRAGAAAMISIYPFWEQGQTRRPTLLTPDGITIPVIVAGQEPTRALLAAADVGGTAQLSVQTISEQRTIDNVIAELPGTGDGILFLGGHLDGVLDGPGINDNGSGTATVLAIAQAARTQPQPRQSIRFGFWGAEEFGDLGSFAYVAQLSDDEIGRISAYINLDMVGSPNAARFVYDDSIAPPGSNEIRDALAAALLEMDAPVDYYDVGASSDHFAFGQAGIPTGGVFSGLGPLNEAQAELFGGVAGAPADPCYHLSCDDRSNINLASAVLLGQAVANVVEDLAY